jgi:hypothetical protein
MALRNQQIDQLEKAILAYAFPPIYFDFVKNISIQAQDMKVVENAVKNMLVSKCSQDVIHGLANIVYWGYAQIGYQQTRVDKFLNGITNNHIIQFKALVAESNIPNMLQIKAIGMPEYSGISFISKILVFLNPKDYCVLDKQLAKLIINGDVDRALYGLILGTQIRVTKHNQAIYDTWRAECLMISKQYFNGKYRVVDIERGFFHLIQQKQFALAQKIYATA